MSKKTSTPREIINLINTKWDTGEFLKKWEVIPKHQIKECFKIIYVQLKEERLPRAFTLTREEYDEYRLLQAEILGLGGTNI